MTTLRTIRSRLGWTQERLAKELGIPRSTLADAERGAYTVTMGRRREITREARRLLSGEYILPPELNNQEGRVKFYRFVADAKKPKRRKAKVFKHPNGDVLMTSDGFKWA